jgi:hypothetical protein
MEQSGEQKSIPTELAPVLDIAAGAFAGEEDLTLHKVFLFDPLKHEDHTWGFVIVTRECGGGRLELAAFSYEVESAGTVARRLESRRAMIPPDRLEDIVEGIVLRLDEPDCSYREVDLSGQKTLEAQLEHLKSRLSGDTDGTAARPPEPDLQHGQGDRPAGVPGAD